MSNTIQANLRFLGIVTKAQILVQDRIDNILKLKDTQRKHCSSQQMSWW
jgi:hypothetical protein